MHAVISEVHEHVRETSGLCGAMTRFKPETGAFFNRLISLCLFPQHQSTHIHMTPFISLANFLGLSVKTKMPLKGMRSCSRWGGDNP